MDVVIVESPAKAGTINKYLGKDAKVLASFGHVRDLPEKDGSVDPDRDFSMDWQIQASASKRLNEIAQALKSADRLVLATDPDREGEAISWHVLEVMQKKGVLKDKQICRVVFNAITRSAVLEAMAHPRELDEKLVDAYLARRALDYLVGFTLSPVLWRKLPGSRSAGRVQSVALRLICEREIEIEAFKPREYWSIIVDCLTENKAKLPTRLTMLDGEKLDKFSLGTQDHAQNACAQIERAQFTITKVEKKPGQRRPSAPFTTSTLQQEAARKLGFNAKRTMQTAQKLYEGKSISGETTGLITYMRTDGLDIAAEARHEIRDMIKRDYGDDYLPQKPRLYTKTAANAQEAHEAIRPTSIMRKPEDVAHLLTQDEQKLYELIWKRTLACQMENARVERTVIDILSDDKKIGLRTSGTIITFMSFLSLYEEGYDDKRADDADDEKRLPPVKEGEALAHETITPQQHFTEPPPRYSEASLVKKMEELGIGRPSTYASVLSVLRDRDYVQMERNRFVPYDKGRLVTAFLENFFARYVEYDFTAELEGDLDKVSNGELDYKALLARFWRDFKPTVDTTLELRNTDVLNRMNDVLGQHIFKNTSGNEGDDPRICPRCSNGALSLKTGRFGAFVGCTLYPDCTYTRPFASDAPESENVDDILGQDPETGEDIHLKNGRFGPYVQKGTVSEENKKPKRASLPKDKTVQDMTLDYALQLLSLPRLVGEHPETGDPITADIGRYGPYLRSGKNSASLENTQEVFDIGINRAVTVLAEKKNKTTQQRRGSSVIKELGDHPENGKPINVLDGRYGPYVKNDKINATIPKGENPEDITVERALELIAARAAKGTTRKKRTTRKKS